MPISKDFTLLQIIQAAIRATNKAQGSYISLKATIYLITINGLIKAHRRAIHNKLESQANSNKIVNTNTMITLLAQRGLIIINDTRPFKLVEISTKGINYLNELNRQIKKLK